MTRIPPHDLDAERSVLASLCMGPWAVEKVLAANLEPSDFHRPAHAAIYTAALLLHDAPSPIDVLSLCAKLESTGQLVGVGGRDYIAGLMAEPTTHPGHYAQVVSGYARCRRAIAFGEEVAELGYGGDIDLVSKKLDEADALDVHGVALVDPPMNASDLAAREANPDWLIPDLLARGEVVLIVAEPGAGKSTLMRQIAATSASAVHPFTRVPIKAVRSLTFDFQDPIGPAVRATRRMLEAAGGQYRQGWFVELRQQGVDLTTRRDQEWFEAKIASVNADLVLAGPVYNMVRGAAGRSKQSEETVDIARSFLMDVTVRQNCSLILEAHAPHGDEMRVRGSKLWEDFAAFGFGLVQDEREETRSLVVDRFRGDRETGRQWPTRFVEGRGRWPWDAVGVPERPPEDEWVTPEMGEF